LQDLPLVCVIQLLNLLQMPLYPGIGCLNAALAVSIPSSASTDTPRVLAITGTDWRAGKRLNSDLKRTIGSKVQVRTKKKLRAAPDDIYLGHRHCLPKHLGHEWKEEVLFDHGEEPASLFQFVVGVGLPPR
jgi:hypothetical protein